MYNGQTGIKNNDLVSDGITIGAGDKPASTNPDQMESITYSAFEAPSKNFDPAIAESDTLDEERPEQATPLEQTSSYHEVGTTPKQDTKTDSEWPSITISGDGVSPKDIAKIEKNVNKMLDHKDAAGVVSAIRGAVPYVLKNTFGDDAVWKEADVNFGEQK